MHEISTFKNKPIIKLKRDSEDKFPFTFGITKAKLILENFVAIEKFAAKYDTSETTQEKVLI